MQRRTFIKKASVSSLALAAMPHLLFSKQGDKMSNQTWDKVFPKNDEIAIKKVEFKNRFGITLVGDLYTPKNTKQGKFAAIAISGPFGAVKEQASGFYAQTLAEQGFITLAFDPSFTGESALANKNLPQNVASPDINTEDFSAAVDFLSNQSNVDAEKIGILGICGFGGFAINAAAMDTRIKATVASTMYDMTRVNAYGYNDTMDAKARYALKEQLNKQRTLDFKNKSYAKAQGLPEKLTGDEPQFIKDYWDYYKTKRGFHKRSINSNGNWNQTSSLSLMNLPILAFSDEIQNAVLVIHGEKAHSRYFSEDAFKKLKGKNKELLIIKDASHVDLYDNADKIPFAKITEFFKANLV
ncbi:alpha/beta hydrolase [Campylobacter cuniculorum]|uniref:Alpha/beta hydrolase family protein n=3 Tax=Campylobacter cuniculorum TaxID=374106 RepID=A0A1W6BZD7_9BACT|nr:alpha/beta hydrolase family protein [Campylobacter cuniculorum DSM 23162 = LMG 24588]QOR04880.1 alpha/beta hydrolase [Campylobacter cuniculorum]